MLKVALVGSPNVGKSVIFNYLTGRYVAVSNYPGTTVEVAKGLVTLRGVACEIVDTPGIYSLIPLTEEEAVTRRLLCAERPDVVVHVIDAKQIKRMLTLTLDLLEAGFAVILVVNMMDEAKQAGLHLELSRLADKLGIPVLATAAVKKLGLGELTACIASFQKPGNPDRYHSHFPPELETAIADMESVLSSDYGLSKRLAALLLLQQDPVLLARLSPSGSGKAASEKLKRLGKEDLSYRIALERQKSVAGLLQDVVSCQASQTFIFRSKLGEWARRPATGIPLACLVLYFGLYLFVGKFGAGFLVDYFDQIIFKAYIIPWIKAIVLGQIPWEWARDLLIGDYGLVSLGFRYAIAIILPVVGSFFFIFALLEDCGYLPRLAMLADRLFKCLGLNGRAVIPVILGFGCGTMAVIVTRTLETKRERILATFLLSLTIPCSAQLGMVVALLSVSPLALGIWGGYITLLFIAVGWLSSKVLSGERSPFYMEIPPLRLPVLANVLMKVYTRVVYYLAEILPVFLITSLLLWCADYGGFLMALVSYIKPVTTLLGLPDAMASIFLLGFFRRDYGTAGLYDLFRLGALSTGQLLVAAITLTLFVPCVAQLAAMIKERGLPTALVMLMLIILLSVLSGFLANVFLNLVAANWEGGLL